jgi:hypothetical protein
MNKWLIIAEIEKNSKRGNKQTYIGEIKADVENLIYRGISKWLLRGGASEILNTFWEYIDQYDNEIEEALLDQFIKNKSEEITSVKTKDYSIDMLVEQEKNDKEIKNYKIQFILYVYFPSLLKKLRIDEQNIKIKVVNISNKIEAIEIQTDYKTPGILNNSRVSKRSSKKMI